MHPFEIRSIEDAAQWDAYVDSHPKGTIFHTSQMVKVYEATRRYEPLALAALDASGQIVAMLVSVRVETLSGVAARFASRSIMFAEPICNDGEEGIAGLTELLRHHDRRMARRTLFTEVRPIWPASSERVALERCGYEHKGYLNYVVDLSVDQELLWRNVRKSCRQNVRRTRRKVVMRNESTEDGVRTMYELLQVSYAHARVPLADISLFQAALELLPRDVVQVRVLYYNDQPVTAGIALNFKDLIYAWYGGTKRVRGITSFDCLTWDEMEWGNEHNKKYYDFGGAGWPDEAYGPRKFKAKFGGQLVNYGRYHLVHSRWKLGLAKAVYRLARNVVPEK